MAQHLVPIKGIELILLGWKMPAELEGQYIGQFEIINVSDRETWEEVRWKDADTIE